MKKHFLYLCFTFFQSIQNKGLNLYFFDVGQGDSTFIETPDKFQILIDGGKNNVVLKRLSEVMPFYDKSIDMLILSHPQKDHLSGLLYVLDRYRVSYLVISDYLIKNKELKLLIDKAEKRGVKIIHPQAGDEFLIGKYTNIYFLYPFKDKVKTDDLNNVSLAFIVAYNNKKIFFAGDAQKQEESIISSLNLNLDSDILKVSHHGSKTSSTNLFLQKITPEISVISVGKNNSYGHPSKDVLFRLKEFGRLLTTSASGTIHILINSKGNIILR